MSIGCREVSQHSPHDVRLNQRNKITDLDVSEAKAKRRAPAYASPDCFMPGKWRPFKGPLVFSDILRISSDSWDDRS
jgi:hypothetical protein